jgi:hypothetical protein
MKGTQLELPFPEDDTLSTADRDERFRLAWEAARIAVQPLIDRLRKAEHLSAETLNFRFGSVA